MLTILRRLSVKSERVQMNVADSGCITSGQIVRDFMMMAAVRPIGHSLSHGQHNNSSKIREVAYYTVIHNYRTP